MGRWDVVKAALGFGAPDEPTGPTFDVDLSDVDPAIIGLTSWSTASTPAPRITRREAIQVPAVKRCRDLIAGTLGALPLRVISSDYSISESSLLEQPEQHVPRSVTMTRLFEDLIFEAAAWWRITQRGWDGYPVKVQRLAPDRVTVGSDGRVRVDGNVVDDRDLIRFYSPNDALLDAGARAIRTALKLDAAAARYADEPMPQGMFTPAEGADPVDDDDVRDLLADWQDARASRATAYVPAALQYQTLQWNPEQLQLADARQHAVLEIARTAGVDPEDLGVSTTSRTYQNGVDRRRDLLDFTLGAYITAVQDRLSMGDVTKRGYTVRFDFNGFLRSNEKERMETYALALEVGATTREEIRLREERPPLPAGQLAPVRALIPVQEQPMSATGDAGPTFDAPEVTAIGFDTDETVAAFSVDVERRTIFGLAVPYGVVGRTGGRRFTFQRGDLRIPADPTRVKLLIGHDRSQAVGRCVELNDAPEGLWAKFSVARGEAGDRALSMAEDGVWDGLSIGLGAESQFTARGGVHLANGPATAVLEEISLTPLPAFGDARVSAVAASADTLPEGTDDMTGTTGTETAPATAPVAPTFDMDALATLVASKLQAPTTGPEVIPAGAEPVFVSEEQPYRFDRGGNLVEGTHDFSTDLFEGLRNGDRQAYDRALSFVRVNFDVDVADGATLNPNVQRPDLYVDQRNYRYPLYEATRAGTLRDKTPFVIPKFNTATGLVAAHTEGVEPTPGTFTATSATVTPGAVSGKVEITRELWDQGGNPQISTLIWRQMEKAYYEALEAKVVAVLDAASPTSLGTLTAGGGTTGQTLSSELAAAIASLQFVRGGFSFDTFAMQIDLYKAIVGALDDAGRPLFPIYNPQNANGTVAPRFGSVNVHGVAGFPEWALAATGTTAASSYLFDRESVRTWASAPERLEFQYRVAYVDLAIWGYSVSAILDTAGVREVIYDPAA